MYCFAILYYAFSVLLLITFSTDAVSVKSVGFPLWICVNNPCLYFAHSGASVCIHSNVQMFITSLSNSGGVYGRGTRVRIISLAINQVCVGVVLGV